MQNINQRTETQCQTLEEKTKGRSAAVRGMRDHLQVLLSTRDPLHLGAFPNMSSVAPPRDSEGGETMSTLFAVTPGMPSEFEDKKNRFISKGWKTMSTHRVLSERLQLPCMCGRVVISCSL